MAPRYTTVDNLHLVLPEIGSVSTLSSGQMAYAIQQAEAVIDGKIALRYTLPFSATPPLLETLATDIALYYLLGKRLFTGQKPAESVWPNRYREALGLLDAIANGEMLIVDSAGTAIEDTSGEAYSTTQDYYPTFHEGHPGDANIDPAKLEDELNRRDIWRRNPGLL